MGPYLRTESGPVDIRVARDRTGTFAPQLLALRALRDRGKAAVELANTAVKLGKAAAARRKALCELRKAAVGSRKTLCELGKAAVDRRNAPCGLGNMAVHRRKALCEAQEPLYEAQEPLYEAPQPRWHARNALCGDVGASDRPNRTALL